MKVKELIAQLQSLDPNTIVVVAGFETQSTGYVAEADTIKECITIPSQTDSMTGNRSLAQKGTPTVWLGWGEDSRTEFFVRPVTDPDEWLNYHEIPKSLYLRGFFTADLAGKLYCLLNHL